MISIKTTREFLDFVASLYKKAKEPLRKSFDNRIVKGRAKCIASQAEEAFANFICKSILKKKLHYKVFVDFPITIKPRSANKGKKTRYIDFMLCKEADDTHYIILYMAELKMNTGWMRHRVRECAKDMAKLHKSMLSGELSARNLEEEFGRMSFTLSKKSLYDLVIFSGDNTDLRELKNDVDAINLKGKCTNAIILTDEPITKGCHINLRDKKLLDNRIRDTAFELL